MDDSVVLSNARNRKLGIFFERAGNPDFRAGIIASVGFVGAIGALEGLLLSRRGASGRGKFILRYGIAQILPSIIWATKPPALVLKRARLDMSILQEAVNSDRRES